MCIIGERELALKVIGEKINQPWRAHRLTRIFEVAEAPPSVFQNIATLVISPSRVILLKVNNLQQVKMIYECVVIYAIGPIPAPLSFPDQITQIRC